MAQRPPNILFLFPDQHRPDWLGTNSDLPLRTPHLDRLAERGIRFIRAFCTSPLCAPSRASLASGRSYDRCGVTNNRQDYPLDQPTYYRALRDAGYRVAGVGKFDLHKPTLDWNLDGSRLLPEWGFTEGIDNEGKFDGSTSFRRNNGPGGPYLSFLHERGLAETYVDEHANQRNFMGAYTTALPDDAYCDNWLSENGLDILRSFPADQSWHLVVNFTGPHNPMDVTASMRERWADVTFPPPHDNDHEDRKGLLRNRQNYAAMVENIDRNVGRFIAQVEERGELENTLIVYSSDHGEMLGDHNRWGKSTWYTPSTGIPLILAGPGIRQNVVSDALVSLHDLCATFIQYSGIPPLEGMDAMTLHPLLKGQTETHRNGIISGLNDWRMIFDGRHKLVIRKDQPPILYDIRTDPLEDQNTAEQHPGVVARLQGILEGQEKEGLPT